MATALASCTGGNNAEPGITDTATGKLCEGKGAGADHVAQARIVELLESEVLDTELFRLRLLYPVAWGRAINRVRAAGWMRAREVTLAAND